MCIGNSFQTSFLAIVSGFLHCTFLSELDKNDIVGIHASRVGSVCELHVVVRTTMYVDGDVHGEYSFDWIWRPGEQRVTKSQVLSTVEGEFSGSVFTLGNRDFYNGPRGFMALKDFDGNLSENQLPADSPASANIGRGRPDTPGIGLIDAFGQIGLHVVGPGVSMPLDTLVASAISANLGGSTRLPRLSLKMDDGSSYVVTLDMLKGGMITESLWMDGKSGSVQLKVEEWITIAGWGEFPSRIKCKLGAKTYYETQIEVVSLNEDINDDLFLVKIPKLTPFYDEESGRYGIWNGDGPAFYFDSELDAKEWSTRRKMEISVKSGASSVGLFQWFVFGAIGIIALAIFLFQRYRKGP